MWLWDVWDDLLQISEALAKLDCASSLFVCVMLEQVLEQLTYRYVDLDLRLNNLFNDWTSREGLMNAPTFVLAELLTLIDGMEQSWGETKESETMIC